MRTKRFARMCSKKRRRKSSTSSVSLLALATIQSGWYGEARENCSDTNVWRHAGLRSHHFLVAAEASPAREGLRGVHDFE
jgi:hypothetical protein